MSTAGKAAVTVEVNNILQAYVAKCAERKAIVSKTFVERLDFQRAVHLLRVQLGVRDEFDVGTITDIPLSTCAMDEWWSNN